MTQNAAQFTKRRREQEAGFSLIELLLVIAIILIIAGVAIPNYLRSRMSANEAAAVACLRNITTGAVVYSTTYGNAYPPSLNALGPPPGNNGVATCDNSNLIDEIVASGQKSGYKFIYVSAAPLPVPAPGCTLPGAGSFSVQANPLTPGTSGRRYFFTDQSGVVRANPNGPASASDSAIQ